MGQKTTTQDKPVLCLNEEEKENLKTLFGSYKKNHEAALSKTCQERQDVLGEWNGYKKEISDNLLTLEKYTNIGENKYLCNFLERESRAFGSSRPGSATQFMVKKNDDKATVKKTKEPKFKPGSYTITQEKRDDATRDDAQRVFEKNVMPLLQGIIEADSLEKICDLEKGPLYKNYQASQILRKMVVLNNAYNKDCLLGFFYQDDAVERLMVMFFGDNSWEKDSFFKRSNAVMEAMVKILGLESKKMADEERHLVSDFLWKLAKISDDTSEDCPNVIYYGAPGTGKTYLVKEMIEFLCQGKSDRYEWTQFHPNYSYEDFIDGIKPTGIDKGNVKLELVNGVFKNFCIRAKRNPDNVYYFVADEINRANLSAVFGETLSKLEADYRDKLDGKQDNLIKTQYSSIETKLIGHSIKETIEIVKNNDETGKQIETKTIKYTDETGKEVVYAYDKENGARFGIPKNIRFIGMMNDVDKSIDAFDLALRRRFKWIRKDCDYNVIRDLLVDKIQDEYLDEYCKSCARLNYFISGTKPQKSQGEIEQNVKISIDPLNLGVSYEFGHSIFLKIRSICKRDTITDTQKTILFDNYLLPTLKEYLRSFYPEETIESKLGDAKNVFLGIEKNTKEPKKDNGRAEQPNEDGVEK